LPNAVSIAALQHFRIPNGSHSYFRVQNVSGRNGCQKYPRLVSSTLDEPMSTLTKLSTAICRALSSVRHIASMPSSLVIRLHAAAVLSDGKCVFQQLSVRAFCRVDVSSRTGTLLLASIIRPPLNRTSINQRQCIIHLLACCCFKGLLTLSGTMGFLLVFHQRRLPPGHNTQAPSISTPANVEPSHVKLRQAGVHPLLFPTHGEPRSPYYKCYLYTAVKWH